MESNSTIAELTLVSKTGRRAALTFKKFTEKGFTLSFFICATSTLTSGSALALLSGSKALHLTKFNYLITPFAVTGTSLGICSDLIDNTFRWYSPFI